METYNIKYNSYTRSHSLTHSITDISNISEDASMQFVITEIFRRDHKPRTVFQNKNKLSSLYGAFSISFLFSYKFFYELTDFFSLSIISTNKGILLQCVQHLQQILSNISSFTSISISISISLTFICTPSSVTSPQYRLCF